MKKLLICPGSIYVCICLFSFFSCKKSDVNPTPDNPSVQKLKKVVSNDEGRYLNYEEFAYNADNLVSLRKDSLASIVGGQLEYTEGRHSYFFYNAGDEKAVRDSTLYWFSSASTNDRRTISTYYYYDGQSRLSRTESFSAGVLFRTKNISYLNGQRVETYFQPYQSGPGGLTYHDTISINGQNQTTSIISAITSVGTVNYEDQFSFDNKRNPYYDVNIMKYRNSGTDSSFSYEQIAGPNNVLVDSSFFSSPTDPRRATGTSVFNYTYNSAGYPVSATRVRTSISSVGIPGTPQTTNITYEYQ